MAFVLSDIVPRYWLDSQTHFSSFWHVWQSHALHTHFQMLMQCFIALLTEKYKNSTFRRSTKPYDA